MLTEFTAGHFSLVLVGLRRLNTDWFDNKVPVLFRVVKVIEYVPVMRIEFYFDVNIAVLLRRRADDGAGDGNTAMHNL